MTAFPNNAGIIEPVGQIESFAVREAAQAREGAANRAIDLTRLAAQLQMQQAELKQAASLAEKNRNLEMSLTTMREDAAAKRQQAQQQTAIQLQQQQQEFTAKQDEINRNAEKQMQARSLRMQAVLEQNKANFAKAELDAVGNTLDERKTLIQRKREEEARQAAAAIAMTTSGTQFDKMLGQMTEEIGRRSEMFTRATEEWKDRTEDGISSFTNMPAIAKEYATWRKNQASDADTLKGFSDFFASRIGLEPEQTAVMSNLIQYSIAQRRGFPQAELDKFLAEQIKPGLQNLPNAARLALAQNLEEFGQTIRDTPLAEGGLDAVSAFADGVLGLVGVDTPSDRANRLGVFQRELGSSMLFASSLLEEDADEIAVMTRTAELLGATNLGGAGNIQGLDDPLMSAVQAAQQNPDMRVNEFVIGPILQNSEIVRTLGLDADWVRNFVQLSVAEQRGESTRDAASSVVQGLQQKIDDINLMISDNVTDAQLRAELEASLSNVRVLMEEAAAISGADTAEGNTEETP